MGEESIFTMAGKGVPTPEAMGFVESEVKALMKAEATHRGVRMFELLSYDKDEIVKRYVKGKRLPSRIKSDNVDLTIDDWNYIGGIYSYHGTAVGYTIGENYRDPDKPESEILYKVNSILIYPDGKIEVNSSSINDVIRHNKTLFFGRCDK